MSSISTSSAPPAADQRDPSHPPLFLAILSISFFWTIGSVLFIQFPPLVKNVLTADKSVASLFLAIFSVGVAIGSVAVNQLLKGEVSARYSTPAVLAMGLSVLAFHLVCAGWDGLPRGQLYDIAQFMDHPGNWPLLASLLGVAVFGGMFVVPLYAFLTTTVPKGQAARTVAANNIVNSGAMVIGSAIAGASPFLGVSARISCSSPPQCVTQPGSPGCGTRPATTSKPRLPKASAHGLGYSDHQEVRGGEHRPAFTVAKSTCAPAPCRRRRRRCARSPDCRRCGRRHRRRMPITNALALRARGRHHQERCRPARCVVHGAEVGKRVGGAGQRRVGKVKVSAPAMP